jgi:ketosteroid isomerase-like protein
MSAGDVEAVRELYATYNRGDYDRATAMLHDDVELHQWGAAPDADVYVGRDEFARGIVRWVSAFEVGFQYVPEELIDAGDRVLARVLLRGRGRESGIELETLVWQVWEVRDGSPSKCTVFSDEAPAREAAGLPAG